MDQEKFIDKLRAGFAGFWMKTHEHDRVRIEVFNELGEFALSGGEKFTVAEWDCISEKPDPMSPLAFLDGAADNTVMFLFNYHWFIDRQNVIQKIINSMAAWANKGKAIVVVSPIEKIPVELQKAITLIDLPMPDDEEIVDAMKHVAPSDDYMPKNAELDGYVRVSRGLTRMELENIYALCLTKHKRFDVATINDYRALMVKKSGLADILPPTKTFNDVIGYQVVKDQVMDTIFYPEAKGIIAIGPTGTGKTSLAQAIATESNKLAVKVRTGKLFSKFQGETDQKTDALIDMLTALGDSFVLFDEFEKQFAGVGSSGELDSGTTSRLGGRFLEFFQDTPHGIYRCATCNSTRGIPPEYFRPGRWDSAPWYVGLPTDKVKKSILNHYIGKFELSKKQTSTIPKMPLWTGAEIEAMCHNARMRKINLVDASQFIIPMALTAKEEYDQMELWAKDRCVNAEDIPKVSIAVSSRKRKLKM